MEPTDTGMSRRGVFTMCCLEHSFYISYQHKHIPTYRKNEGTGLIIVWKVFLSSLFRSHFFSFFINYDFFVIFLFETLTATNQKHFNFVCFKGQKLFVFLWNEASVLREMIGTAKLTSKEGNDNSWRMMMMLGGGRA